MKTHFRLYSDTKLEYSSSIFDLISSSDRETKQTKGLAYIFSQYPDFLFKVLNFPSVSKKIEMILGFPLKIKKISSIEVSAERYTFNKKRADIVVKIDSNSEHLLAIIIEAKSIKVNSNKAAIASQIGEYLDDKIFPDLKGYKKTGIVLTKYNQNIPNAISLTWDEIIQLLINFCKNKGQNEIIQQYLNFIIGIDKAMKYYEEEVLSLSAGKSLPKILKFKIYECPDTADYNYKKPLFVAFRKGGGGIMDRLYKIDEILLLNPSIISEVEALKNSTLPEGIKKRILGCISESNYPANMQHDQRFYILSLTDNIQLKNKPKPERNNTKHRYYSLTEILTKSTVTPESQKKTKLINIT